MGKKKKPGEATLEKVADLHDLARRLGGLSTERARQLCVRGEVTARKCGGGWVIWGPSIDAYLARPRRKAGRPKGSRNRKKK
jgi:hypothetical protein